MPPSTFTFTDLKSTVAASKGQAKLAATDQGEKKGKGNKGEWLKQNKDVNRRAARDVELREAALDRHSHESIKAKMEKKSEQYNQLKRGLTGGLTEAQLAEQAVDWVAKAEHRFSSEGEDSENEGHTDAEASEPEDEPTVEYVDDFGRSHFAPRSKVPLQYRRNIQTDEPDEDDGGIVINDARHHFPVYEPTVEQLAKVEESLQEEEIEMHYDASRNVRDHGAAHYRFSRDTEQRARERAELDHLHAQAQAARAEAGAVDIRPGTEGMQSNERAPSSAARKRKAELEERRNKIKQKKRAMNGGDESNLIDPVASLDAKPGKQDLEQATDAFLASLEASIKRE